MPPASDHLRGRCGAGQLVGIAVGIQIETAVQVEAEEGEQRFVKPSVPGTSRRIAQVNPDAVEDAVTIVVDVPWAGDGVLELRKVRVVGGVGPQQDLAEYRGRYCATRAGIPIVDQRATMERWNDAQQPVRIVRIGNLHAQCQVLTVGHVVAFVGAAGEVSGLRCGIVDARVVRQ